MTAAFGRPNNTSSSSTHLGHDPFSSITSAGDPFSLTLKSSLNQSSSKNSNNNHHGSNSNSSSTSKLKNNGSGTSNSARKDAFDPFGMNNDPFAASPFGGGTSSSAAKHQSDDPFGSSFSSSDAFASKDDWFTGVPKSAPKVDGVSKMNKLSKSSSQSLATSWSSAPPPISGSSKTSDPFNKSVTKVNNADPFGPMTNPKKKSGKSHHGFADFLTNSPMKSISEERSEKKRHRFLPKLGGKSDKSKPGSSSPGPTNQQQRHHDQFQLQKATEASAKAEEERQRRLQDQEERDLAYAIALSKAEAASLKTSS